MRKQRLFTLRHWSRWRNVLWVGLGLGLMALAVGGCRPRASQVVPPTATVAPTRAVGPTTTPASKPTALSSPAVTPHPTPTGAYKPILVAVIGDFGLAGPAEAAVADLVHQMQPDLVVTVGDNNYPSGSLDTWEENVTAYYGDFLERERFFPAWGNHDWGYHRRKLPAVEKVPYLPEPRRYYTFVYGPAQFFVLDSNWQEPDGIRADSRQARWLAESLRASRVPWQIVVLHHAPYSSGRHGSQAPLQWPYRAWGADLVLAGHDHTYERIEQDGLLYIVNGIGGNPSLYEFPTVVPGSQIRFNQDHGALFLWLDGRTLRGEMHTLEHGVIDTFTLQQAP